VFCSNNLYSKVFLSQQTNKDSNDVDWLFLGQYSAVWYDDYFIYSK